MSGWQMLGKNMRGSFSIINSIDNMSLDLLTKMKILQKGTFLEFEPGSFRILGEEFKTKNSELVKLFT